MTINIVLYKDINKEDDFDSVIQMKGISNDKCPPKDYEPPSALNNPTSYDECECVEKYYPNLKVKWCYKTNVKFEGYIKSGLNLEFSIQIIVPNIYPFILPWGRAYCIQDPSTLYLFNEYPRKESPTILSFINNSVNELALKIINQ